MFLVFAFAAAIKSAPFARRDYYSQADIIAAMLTETRNEISDFEQIADYFGDDIISERCEFANDLLKYVAELVKMQDPRFQDDDWWLLNPGFEDDAASTAYYEARDAVSSWDPDDAQSTGEPETVRHTTY